jgi:hypothetical protein
VQGPSSAANASIWKEEKYFLCCEPTFENNRKVKILPVDYDENYIRAVMVKAEQF